MKRASIQVNSCSQYYTDTHTCWPAPPGGAPPQLLLYSVFPSYLVYWRSWKHTVAVRVRMFWNTKAYIFYILIVSSVCQHKLMVHFLALLTLISAFLRWMGDWWLFSRSFLSPSSCGDQRSPPQTSHCALLRRIRSMWSFPGCWVWGLSLEIFPWPSRPE